MYCAIIGVTRACAATESGRLVDGWDEADGDMKNGLRIVADHGSGKPREINRAQEPHRAIPQNHSGTDSGVESSGRSRSAK
jgi:hypothetical protein